MQLAIITGVTVLVTGLFLAPLSAQLDEEAMRRALAVARSTAAQPGIAEDLRTTEPSAPGPVQSAANADGPLSAQEITERAGMSRQTAQRYLKLLERTGKVRLALRYGETGRPEHRYTWAQEPFRPPPPP